MSKLEKGFAGKLAEQFINSRLTPVIAIVSILLGLMSVYLTPKEEEPQISVPMIDIQIFAPGFEAKEVERKVTEKVERAVWGLDGVEYVYSATKAHGSIITVRFKVGEPTEPSLVKVHHKLMEIRQDLPSNVLPPKISSFTIDDVPFLTLSFSSSERDDYDLRKKIAPLARELSSTPDLSRVELLGGRRESIRIILDPVKASNQGVSVLDVANTLKMSDAYFPMGKTYSKEKEFQVEVGGRLSSSEEVGNLAIGQRGGSIVRLKDIAKIQLAAEERNRLSILYDKDNGTEPKNAVSIVFAKRKGTNVVVLAKDLMERAETFTKDLPADIKMSIVRNYGTTAEEKSFELIEHLLIATISVTVLIALVMGLRSAIVVSIAIPVTLALTLAIYYFMGYTLNRVTLFALIFSIGILVDDAIVVVENVERHLHLDPESGILKATINAVSEVGNPTILATFTVIAAILPMAFVQGLMGPYMKPIPVGASLAMILSLFVAFIVTPWASVRLLKQTVTHHSEETPKESFLDKLYISFSEMLLGTKKAAFLFGIISIILLLSSFSFIYFKWVKVKMLPFDNKNEFQITIDYPPDTPLEKSVEWSKELSAKLLQEKEVKKIQIYAGESAPFSFSGMVKHTFLRKEDYMNDLQILLSDKGKRKESSHKIIERLRPIIQEFGKEKNAITKVLEIPPGPPVMATMVAEVYGPTEEIRRQVAKEIYSIFEKEKSVVDLDYSWRESKTRKVYDYDQIKGGILGAKSMQVVGVGSYIFTESNLASLAEADAPEETNVVLSVDNKVRSSQIPFQGSKIASFESGVIPVDSLLKNPKLISNEVLHRKNLKPVSYVLSELSGAEEAPVYGMLKLAPNINYPTQTADVPWNTKSPVIKWDGEWFITYEVFRDLGGAFGVVMILIYILVLGWFKSYTVPLIIMTPIPISLIGILPGHAMLGAYFTATSMIGFIAGAGIIVRNSIILVDFIEEQLKEGQPLKEAVISAGVIRFRPMLLTAAAVVVGSFIMLFDPIFEGLAISLMFGEVAATALSRFAVPVLYYWFVGKSRVKLFSEANS
ncbi:MAG TPA: efflux RND transporter permease subunit [Leptospiraceae bacterium]|nr:efflux RND transporter permease subunit [Leptospiraceae bacterium]HMX32185.1 efflux RND transporter permease subunit [Leptospiraceae bacterium]HMY32255.1 efflux RND transporter permease subunit [Leptospiraceae bacterium]HMZ63944.1 efflux RND transporter permease subunit [Leptospiraceae bacterium]HNA09813.1 efflux RND transporter permease subunit [Leptospiraceae bacterium]